MPTAETGRAWKTGRRIGVSESKEDTAAPVVGISALFALGVTTHDSSFGDLVAPSSVNLGGFGFGSIFPSTII